MFNSFEEMFQHYRRRCIFTQHDFVMVKQEIVHDKASFWLNIVRPKIMMGRLNHGDAIRILAVLD